MTLLVKKHCTKIVNTHNRMVVGGYSIRKKTNKQTPVPNNGVIPTNCLTYCSFIFGGRGICV